MTVMEFQAKKMERIAAAFADFLGTTAEDAIDWHPVGQNGCEGRSALEQAEEIIIVNGIFARLLRGETIDVAKERSQHCNFVDIADAQAQVIASGQDLADTVRNLADSDLERIFPFWRGPVTGEVLIEMPYRNMAYHCGQVNYIQCLSGDSEFHAPPTWL